MTMTSSLAVDDRRMIADTMSRFAAERYDLADCRAQWRRWRPEDWSAYADLGLLALSVPERWGGIGGGAIDLGTIMREIGRNLLVTPYLDAIVIGARIVDLLASEDQKQALMPMIVAGDLRLGLAHREPQAGSDRGHVEAVSKSSRIYGVKHHVADPSMTNRLIVSARTEDGQLGLFLVDPGQPGVATTSYRLPDGRAAATIVFEGAEGERLGGMAESALDFVLDLAAACSAAESAGAMAALVRDTIAYAKTRRQFGVAIGSFQALQHRMVDMFIAEQTASAMVDDALAAIDGEAADAPLRVSAAKAQADRAGRLVGEAAIQVHGGMGMTDECSVGHHLKRLLANGSQFGTATWHIDRLGEIESRSGPGLRFARPVGFD